MITDDKKWITNEIRAGLGLLIAAGLPGAPGQFARSQQESAAAAAAAVRGWEIAILSELQPHNHISQAAETKRIRVAFKILLRKSKKFPAPADLIEHLNGSRPDPLRLPEPPPSPEQQARGLAEIRKIRDKLRMAG